MSRFIALSALAQLAAAQTVDQTSVVFTPSGSDVMSYRVTFYRPGTVRFEALLHKGNNGNFAGLKNETGILTHPADPLQGDKPTVSHSGDVYTIKYAHTGDYVTVTRPSSGPTTFAVNGKVSNISLSNTQGLNQKIGSDVGEKFYGLGMSGVVGYDPDYGKIRSWNLAGDKVTIDNSEQSKAPFFISSKLYAIFNNDWNPATYAFGGLGANASDSLVKVKASSSQTSFDFFVFSATDVPGLVDQYTYLTGRPFMIPIYGLQLGGSDCFHDQRHDWHSSSAISMVKAYERLDIPLGWYQYDDGYGCGIGDNGAAWPDPKKPQYDLDTVISIGDAFVKMGVKPGIWAAKASGLGAYSQFIAQGNMSVTKTDVGWLGSGYKTAFDTVEMLGQTMEANADIRRFIWTIMGWSGTGKNAVMWSGDQGGGGDYALNQITWYTHATLSGFAYTSGDLDGIYGGSMKTAVRDMQFKTFLPVVMTMSGWGNDAKEVFAFGDVVTGIMRSYIQLKAQLTPYQYTLAYQATQNGLGMTRPMLTEFPEDPITWETNNYTLGQFMSGPSFLIVPEPLGTEHIQSVYLPGKDFLWYDFNTNFWRPAANLQGSSIPAPGTGIKAGTNLSDLTVPLAEQVMFVREGAVIPMWASAIQHVKDVDLETMPLLATIWAAPHGEANVMSGEFELYEDDGVTQAYRKMASTLTKIAWTRSGQSITVTITRKSNNGQTPAFPGAPKSRDFILRLPVITSVKSVTVNGATLPPLHSTNSIDYYPSGWTVRDLAGVAQVGLHAKLGNLPCDETVTVVITE